MGMPAARLTDLHACPIHGGGPILPPCAPTVLIGSLPAARQTDMAFCFGGPDAIALGSLTVLTVGLPQARIADPTVHLGMVAMGLPTVLVGP